jgi:hypothetical protein
MLYRERLDGLHEEIIDRENPNELACGFEHGQRRTAFSFIVSNAMPISPSDVHE